MIMHPAIKLRHIRAFLDIVDARTLSEAARRQGISQPALSRTLAELEGLLGTALFLREKRSLLLTAEGTEFRRHASVALQALDAGAAALRPSGVSKKLRVGILPTAASQLFPRVALHYNLVSPQDVLEIETGSHAYLLRLLKDGAISMMVGRMPAAADIAGLVFEHLYEDPVILVARADHPFADQSVATILGAVPMILPPADALIRRMVDDYLASLGLLARGPMVETVALAVGRGIVMGSDAVWFISRGVVAVELQRGELIELRTGLVSLSGAVGITRRQGQSADARLELLAQLCRDCAGIGQTQSHSADHGSTRA